MPQKPSDLLPTTRLNRKIWKGSSTSDSVRRRLLAIARDFVEEVEFLQTDILDIVLTGSMASYNWTKKSDLDLHILVDFSTIDRNTELVKKYVNAKKTVWNNKHEIRIFGFEVEVYIQDANEPHYSTGIYSVKKDEWIEKPSQIEPEIDVMNIQKKAATLMDDVDEVYELFTNEEYEPAYKLAEKIKDKIRKFRQAGLESGGAYSVENLAFKVLRRNEYLRKLSSLKVMSYDKMMSINGEHP